MADLQIVPAGKTVEAQYVEMKVPLYSYGCEKKVKKALAHLKGIYSVHVDYELQKVTVWGICDRYDVLATIKKKRREARFWDCEESSGEKTPSPSPPPPPLMERAPPRMLCKRKSWKRLFPLVLY